MAAPDCVICLEPVGLGAERATLANCYHQYCAGCILQYVGVHGGWWCPSCRIPIGEVHWGGQSLDVPAAAPAVAVGPPRQLGRNEYLTPQNGVVFVIHSGAGATVGSVALHYGVPVAQLVSMNQNRAANPWAGTVTASGALVTGTAVWLWHCVI